MKAGVFDLLILQIPNYVRIEDKHSEGVMKYRTLQVNVKVQK